MADHGHKRDTHARPQSDPTQSDPTLASSTQASSTQASSTGRFERRRKRVTLLAAPIAALATVGAVGIGVLTATPGVTEVAAAGLQPVSGLAQQRTELTVSRSQTREALIDMARATAKLEAAERAAQTRQRARAQRRATERAIADADTKLWTTVDLNVWPTSVEQDDLVDILHARTRVLVTGRKADGRTEIVIDGASRWVTSGYLATEKPEKPEKPGKAESGPAGLGGACTNGTSVAGGVSPNIVATHQAVCAAFPSISVYGTLRGGGGDHPLGRAVDIMVSGSLGWQVADFVRAHYSELGVSYIIYAQRIWSVERGGEGWRAMSDRGSVTANHYDHVHVSTY